MSDPTTPTVPSLAASLAHSFAQKAAAMAAAALLSGHLIPAADVPADTQVLAGAILLAVSVAWTWIRDKISTDRAKALAAAAK